MKPIPRRMFAATLASIALFQRAARGAPLPAHVQAELLVKVGAYDRSLRARAGEQVRTLIVKTDDSASNRWAAEILNELSNYDRMAGLPHVATVATYTGASDLAARCKLGRIAIAFLSIEAALDVDRLKSAFEGSDVLTVTSLGDLVRRGIVLGFELVSGKPKLFFNLPQAKRQGIGMSSDILKLMTVFQ